MSDNTNTQNSANANTSEENSRYDRICSAIDDLKDRPINRRGPFVISNEDLTSDYCKS